MDGAEPRHRRLLARAGGSHARDRTVAQRADLARRERHHGVRVREQPLSRPRARQRARHPAGDGPAAGGSRNDRRTAPLVLTAREKALVGIALLFAALFVRLGFWQLDRLRERKAFNAPIESRINQPPVDLRELPRDPAVARYRRVRLSGEYDYARELVLVLRSRQGSPGVNLLTPLRVPGSDTAVLVNRGWIYAPDGMTADTKPWRERNPAGATGYVL